MRLTGTLSKDSAKHIEINIDENATVADLRALVSVLVSIRILLQKESGCTANQISIVVNNAVYEDAVKLSTIPFVSGSLFEYTVNLEKKYYTFEYNKRKMRIGFSVGSTLHIIQDVLLMVIN